MANHEIFEDNSADYLYKAAPVAANLLAAVLYGEEYAVLPVEVIGRGDHVKYWVGDKCILFSLDWLEFTEDWIG